MHNKWNILYKDRIFCHHSEWRIPRCWWSAIHRARDVHRIWKPFLLSATPCMISQIYTGIPLFYFKKEPGARKMAVSNSILSRSINSVAVDHYSLKLASIEIYRHKEPPKDILNSFPGYYNRLSGEPSPNSQLSTSIRWLMVANVRAFSASFRQ